jgi:hypothetical protein
MLAVETSAQEAAAAQDNATLHVKNAEDRDALVEREALERLLRVEADNAMVLASACEDAKGFACKTPFLKKSSP